jgi:hypothetical protein
MSKPFILRGPDRYPNSYIGEYLGDPMQVEVYDFMRTKLLDLTHDYNLRFEVLTTKDKICKYDLVQVNTPHNYLFSTKAMEILTALCPDQIQIFNTLIECKDGIITEYKAINILNKIEIADLDRCVFNYFTDGEIRGYKKWVFKNYSMGRLHIARDKIFEPAIIISATLKEAFEKAKIKGCQYWSGD